MASAGALFHKRMAEGENEALRMLVLHDGTSNSRGVGVSHGHSGATSI